MQRRLADCAQVKIRRYGEATLTSYYPEDDYRPWKSENKGLLSYPRNWDSLNSGLILQAKQVTGSTIGRLGQIPGPPRLIAHPSNMPAHLG